MAIGLLELAGTLAAAYVAVALLAFLFQRRLEYVPDRSSPPLPRGGSFSTLREIALRTADGVELKAWYWPGEEDTTFVLFHGNAGHRGDRLDWMATLRHLGVGVFIFDYRGYGGSGGAPTEAGIYLDGEAALAWLRENVDGSLVYLGQSLGGGIAVELAARHPPSALILQNSSISAVETASCAYPYLPVRLLMWDRYDCSERVAEVRAPILSIHGEEDRVIPIELGRRLFEAAKEPKEWWAVPGAGHNDLVDVAGLEYLRRIAEFLERTR